MVRICVGTIPQKKKKAGVQWNDPQNKSQKLNNFYQTLAECQQGFLSKCLSPFSYEKPLFISNSIVFNLGIFSYHLLRINYEFNLVFHLIRAFHIGLFFLTLPSGFLYLMLPCGLISFVDRPHHQFEINLITNILS